MENHIWYKVCAANNVVLQNNIVNQSKGNRKCKIEHTGFHPGNTCGKQTLGIFIKQYLKVRLI